jgi:hypothetical protein
VFRPISYRVDERTGQPNGASMPGVSTSRISSTMRITDADLEVVKRAAAAFPSGNADRRPSVLR